MILYLIYTKDMYVLVYTIGGNICIIYKQYEVNSLDVSLGIYLYI